MTKKGETKRPDEEIWWTGLRWVEAAHIQVYRVQETVAEWNAACEDARMRSRLNDDSENSLSRRESTDRDHERYDPQRPIRVPSFSLWMLLTTEFDMLIVAIRNVLRAQERIPVERQRPITGQEAVRLLRNIAEHYDDLDGPSAEELTKNHSGIEPTRFAYINKEIWLGGLEGIPLSRVRAWLECVRQALVAALNDVGHEVPDDLASIVDGDDDLPWPPERLRYHWSIRQVEEQEWPRETAPPKIADLLAARFANQRARDPHD